MKAKRSIVKFSMSRRSGTIQAKFRLFTLVCFSLIVSILCSGCFEETHKLVLNTDGSGHYESVTRFNPQMSVFIEMAEKVAAAKGFPSGDDSPFSLVSPNLEASIRAIVEQIEGARLLRLETTRFGEQNEQRQVSFALDFDDINTFLASPLGFEKLGLRLRVDAEGNLHLKGTPRPLVAIPPAGGGTPILGILISQMKSQFGIAGDPEFDVLFRRLLSSPKSALTFVAPTPIKQTNGALVQGNKVEWKVDIIDAATAPGGDLYEVVLEGADLAFDVREMPQPMVGLPSATPPSPLLGQPAPAFTLADLEGKMVSLSDFKGKVVILDFWATWCGPCVVEIPYFIKLQDALGEKGFTLLGISTDDGVDVVKKFVAEHRVNYPNLMADGNVQALYGRIQSIPTTFVLDKDGVIQRHYVGTQPEAIFHQDVATLLAGETLPPQPIHTMPSPGPPQPPPPGEPSATLVGLSAPAFTLTNLEGKSVSLSDFKGKVVLLDFWATWCPPCAKEIPHFIELYKAYKAQGFEMVGISVDREDMEVVKSFVEQHQVNYPILMSNLSIVQSYRGISSIPTAFLIDREGRIRRQYVGYRDKSVFEADIKAFLTGQLMPPEDIGGPVATGTIRGNVKDTTAQNPISGVKVIAVSTDGKEYEGKTDDQGEFEIPDLPPGRYLLSLYKTGYQDRLGRPVTVVAGGENYIAYKMMPR